MNETIRELIAWFILLITSSALIGLVVSAWIHQNEKWAQRRFMRRRNPNLLPFWDREPDKNKQQGANK